MKTRADLELFVLLFVLFDAATATTCPAGMEKIPETGFERICYELITSNGTMSLGQAQQLCREKENSNVVTFRTKVRSVICHHLNFLKIFNYDALM